MNKQKNTKRKKDIRYQVDEEFRNRLKKQSRERYHIDINYKEATLERAKKRYHEDEEYKQATIQRATKRYFRLKIKRLIESKYLNCVIRREKNLYDNKEKKYNGFEVHLIMKNKQELEELSLFLKKFGFKLGKLFRNNNQFIQIIKGKEVVEEFRSLLLK